MAAARAFVGTVSVVSGVSMSPTFLPGTWVHAAPITDPVARGDVVVIDDGHEDLAVKRVVGLPGETVCLRHGYVFINRRILLEPYIPLRVYTFPRQGQAFFVLGPDQYFVLGDNRPTSADSRMFGPVERKHLRQRVTIPEDSPRPHIGPFSLPDY
jgi:signal peptidase I